VQLRRAWQYVFAPFGATSNAIEDRVYRFAQV
jgi:hypothetical protein